MLQEYIDKNPDKIASGIICKLKWIADNKENAKEKADPFKNIPNEKIAKAQAIEIVQELSLLLKKTFD